MQSGIARLLFLLSAVVLLICPPKPVSSVGQGEKSSCGEYFGEFPHQFNINRRGGAVIESENDTAVGHQNQNELVVNLALLLPSEDGEGCEECLLRPVLPVIELAIVRAQTMLNEFMMEMDENNRTVIRFRRLFGDTKCSSTVGPLVAVEMVTKTRPGKRWKAVF